MMHPDLLYEMFRQDHPARIGAAEQSRHAHLARNVSHHRPAKALVAAGHRLRRQWLDRRQGRGGATECA
jgi:hypothetical protein